MELSTDLTPFQLYICLQICSKNASFSVPVTFSSWHCDRCVCTHACLCLCVRESFDSALIAPPTHTHTHTLLYTLHLGLKIRIGILLIFIYITLHTHTHRAWYQRNPLNVNHLSFAVLVFLWCSWQTVVACLWKNRQAKCVKPSDSSCREWDTVSEQFQCSLLLHGGVGGSTSGQFSELKADFVLLTNKHLMCLMLKMKVAQPREDYTIHKSHTTQLYQCMFTFRTTEWGSHSSQLCSRHPRSEALVPQTLLLLSWKTQPKWN